MALTPDPGETFLREVDENLRRDQLRTMARKYAPLWIAGIVLLLAAVGGWLFWQDKQKKDAAADSEALAQVYTDIGAGQLATVPTRLDARPGRPDSFAHRLVPPPAAVRSSRTTARCDRHIS